MTTNKEKLVASILRLEDRDYAAPCSGWNQRVYLDPETSEVYLYQDVGNSYPSRVFREIDQLVCVVPDNAISDTLVSALMDALDKLIMVLDNFAGAEWDGSNFIGTWRDGDYVDHVLANLDLDIHTD